MKLKSAKNLDARQTMLLEHAYFQVRVLLLHSQAPTSSPVAYMPAPPVAPCKWTDVRTRSWPLPVQVRPPERMALPKKLRPPLHAFIRHLLRDVLAQDTLQHVGPLPTCRQPTASDSMSRSKPRVHCSSQPAGMPCKLMLDKVG